MAETLKHVTDFVDEAGIVDVTESYGSLREIIDGLVERVQGRLDLQRDPSTDRFEDYGGEGPRGTLRAYAGPEVDWAIHSWIANPQASFSNLHLTVWLGPQVRVPHLGIAFGTFPHVWCYLDYVPRADLAVDLDYLDTYYGPVNEEHLEIRARKDLDPFISRDLYVRTALSDTAHTFSAQDPAVGLAAVRELAGTHVDRWLQWLADAPPTPDDQRAALAERDLTVRRNIAERDPANAMGVRLFGQETTDALVRALWGGDRVLPRPHER